jgi:predicted enzyme related to lactoylglutathione lyase
MSEETKTNETSNETSNETMKSQVIWFDIPCEQLDRAIQFYSAVLGCEIEKQGGGDFFMGILPHGGPAIGGCLAVMSDTKPSTSGVLIYLNCDGRLEHAVGQVESNGGAIQKPIHAIGPHGFRAIVIDSEGNRVALHSN